MRGRWKGLLAGAMLWSQQGCSHHLSLGVDGTPVLNVTPVCFPMCVFQDVDLSRFSLKKQDTAVKSIWARL